MMMQPISDDIQKFFADFERASNTFERDLLALQWHDPFVAADPQGSIQVVSKSDFLAGIARRQAFFQSLGFRFVKVVPLAQMPLLNNYLLVKAHTHMRFEKEAGRPVDMVSDAVYILFIEHNSPRVVFHLTHENLMEVLQKHGLLPGAAPPLFSSLENDIASFFLFARFHWL